MEFNFSYIENIQIMQYLGHYRNRITYNIHLYCLIFRAMTAIDVNLHPIM